MEVGDTVDGGLNADGNCRHENPMRFGDIIDVCLGMGPNILSQLGHLCRKASKALLRSGNCPNIPDWYPNILEYAVFNKKTSKGGIAGMSFDNDIGRSGILLVFHSVTGAFNDDGFGMV